MSKRPGRILIVDDEQNYREVPAEVLRRQGYKVDAVETIPEALKLLNSSIYHLVILDILLADEKDGIELLRELKTRGLQDEIQVVMLSVFPNHHYMRQAFKDFEVADFLDKNNFSPQILLDSIQQVFAKKMQINLDLEINWQNLKQPEDILLNMRLDGKAIKRFRQPLFDELEDLLCRLFPLAETILVRPLTPGWSGEKVLLVQPYYGSGKGTGQDVIVKFGDTRRIARERDHFRDYVKPFVSGARFTTILDQRSTWHLGGTSYSLLGIGNDELVNFPHFYQHNNDVQQIHGALYHLFHDTCGNWFDNRSERQPYNLAADYRAFFQYAPKQLEQILSHLPIAIEKGHFTAPLIHPSRQFTNPLQIAAKLSLTCFTYNCIVHGDFNPYNLFVETSGFTWLIDFQSTGYSHILHDFAMLDSAIRFQLLAASEATLEERLQMEDILCKATRFSQVKQLETELTTQNLALAKAFSTIIYLRTLAGTIVSQAPGVDMNEYYVALLFNALNTLNFSTLDPVQHEHALFCASLLVDTLGLERK